MENNILFITGRGRSGTWLLQAILNYHANISIAPESIFVIQFASKYQHQTNWNEQLIHEFIKDLKKDQKINDWWNLDYNELYDTLLRIQHLNYSLVCIEVYKQYAKQNIRSSIIYHGDKNPEYSLKLNELYTIFPNARSIVLVRDPRDNISSYINVKFDLSNPFSLAGRWNFYNTKIKKFLNKYPDKVLLIRYEDLVLYPEDTLRNICKFLSVNFNKELLNFYNHSKNVYSWNKKISSEINKDNVYKWKKKPSIYYQKINYLCKGNIRYFNYEPGKIIRPNFLDYIFYHFGYLISYIEIFYYYLPLNLKQLILKLYRKKTKTFN